VARIHLDLPAIIMLGILAAVFASMKITTTLEICRHKEISAAARVLFALRNATLLIFLAIALVGLLRPTLWNQQQVDVIAGIVWFACWLVLGTAFRILLKRQSRVEEKLSSAPKTQ
jgi:hypothetical protein